MVVIRSPDLTIVILGDRVRYIQPLDGLFQIVKIGFVRKLGVVVADHNQAGIFILVVETPQRGDYVLAINSAKGPHVNEDDFAAQIAQAQGSRAVQPDLVGQFRRRP
jgi:hypothetical protein